jgi:hypothetical protein
MASVNADLPTLADVAATQAPDGEQLPLVNMLVADHPILEHAVFQEGNLANGHKFFQTSELPSVDFRSYNQGVAVTKGRGAPVTETCGQLYGLSKVDVELAGLGGNDQAYRLMQDKLFIEAMRRKASQAFIYQNADTDPETMHGFIPRLDALSGAFGDQIIDSGVSANPAGSQASILIVNWHPSKVFGIVPKGVPAGLQTKDLGERLVRDADNKEYTAWVTKFVWQLGLCVMDPRAVVRIANIDISELVVTGKKLIDALINGVEQIENPNEGRTVIYMPRSIRTYLRHQMIDRSSYQITFDTTGGKPVMRFGEFPVHRVDQMLLTEGVVA